MKIKAAICRRPGQPFVVEEVEIEDPRPDEVLVRLVATGVCHTDMVMRDQGLPVPLPAVLGHEGAGVVEKVGADVAECAPGDPVVMSFNSCGRCPSCADRAPAYCHDFFPRNFLGRRPDGTSGLSQGGEAINGEIFGQSSFATYALCHRANVVKVRKDAPLKLLGPLGCGIQTGAGTILEALRVRPGAAVAILGAGAVGLSAVMAARIAKAGTIAVADLHRGRLETAMALGATHAVEAAPGQSIDQLVGPDRLAGFDYMVDTTGVGDVVNAAAMTLAPRGVLALVGAYSPDARLCLDMAFLMSAGRSVVGVVEGGVEPAQFIPRLVDYYMSGELPLDRLVRFFPFDQINEAVRASETGAVIKPVLVFQ
ncbi:NAD(P)-dependent alcohol dehydrogenase [Phenylobacterium montanum]|uniref:NAD(P)-dependent alcohol dehydrogenase n=1 Tax=Phenylobacterium montanum TaxID=2823693 RepID=A0A975G332_9CAUL|nr:NAD(P)-dependent alcohol dehydrogenase [Caulobacter sp. S6]QUD89663.1 NAD(P)-dependent alcohol dehydrogenase [Caulobacter sp. S6]